MDTFGKSIPLFFLIILLFCTETLARESRFFNKVSRESKDVQQVKVEAKEEEEEPTFVPQTSENTPYGLYGSGTDESTPSTTTTEKLNYQTQKEQPTYMTTAEPEYSNYFYHKNYATELQGVDGYSKGNGNTYFYNNNKKENYYYNGERQGMSDTRFVESGKYYYDVNNEKRPTYNYGAYQNFNNGGSGRRPEYYNNEGYYSGSTQSFYDNKGQQTLQEQDFDFDP